MWWPEMNNTNYITSQVDRSFLYLMGIYAIHGILLHVFLMHPQFDGVNMDWNIVAIHMTNSWKSSIVKNNTSILGTEERMINLMTHEKSEELSEVRKYDHINKHSIVTNKLHQPEFSRAATCDSLLNKLEVTCGTVLSYVSTILKIVSPADLGVILGCMVFLLTFTDNINIP